MRSSLLILALSGLFGCATAPTAGQQPVPEEFLAACTAQEPLIVTNGDLVRARKALQEALKACNLDKEAIRQWSDALVTP